jgi:hypothetical protein
VQKIEPSTFNAEQSKNSRAPLYRRSADVPGRSNVQRPNAFIYSLPAGLTWLLRPGTGARRWLEAADMDGVLTVTLPKAEEAKPKPIAVTVN